MKVDQYNLIAYLKAHGIEKPQTEHKFHPTRKWRFDFAWPEKKVALEIEGITYRPGQAATRHQRGRGYERDCEKYNAAAVQGWFVLRATPQMLQTEEFIKDLLSMLRDGVVAA